MAAVINRLRRCLRREEGAELIEFMIVFPILMLIFAAILDFGMMFRSYEVVTNAAREGARLSVLAGYDKTAVDLRVHEYLDSAGIKWTAQNPAINWKTAQVATAAGTISVRKVQVIYTYQPLVLGGVSKIFGSGIGNVSLQAVSSMRLEAQAAP
jgi:Flp pilus assembly protein TadG